MRCDRLEDVARNALLSGRAVAMMVSPQEAASLRARSRPAKGVNVTVDDERAAWALDGSKEHKPSPGPSPADRSCALRRLLLEARR